jgi:hypothetical membrane protein
MKRPPLQSVPRKELLQACAIAAGALTLFVLAVVFAAFDPRSSFSFVHDFLSELGTGHSLRADAFNAGLIVAGVGLAYFFALLAIASRDRRGELLVCGCSGFVGSICLCLVGLFPYNRNETVHVVAMVGWLLATLPMTVSWWEWTYRRTPGSRLYRWIRVSLLVTVPGYAPATLFGFSPLWQKFVVLASFGFTGALLGQLLHVLIEEGGFDLQDPESRKQRWRQMRDEINATTYVSGCRRKGERPARRLNDQ